MTRLVLVCGMPGAGKTSVATVLARQLEAIRLAPDDWLIALDRDAHDAPFRRRLEHLLWEHAQQLLRIGTSVVLEFGFWSRLDRDRRRRTARELGVEVELHALDVPLDERWRRIELRNASGHPVQITYEQLASYDHWWQPPTAGELSHYDPPTAYQPAPVRT